MQPTKSSHTAFSLAILLFLSLFPIRAHAKSDTNYVDIGLSATSYQLNRQSSKDNGETSTFGTNFYQLYLQGNFPIGKSFLFSPNLRYGSPFTVKSPDGGSTSSLTAIGLPTLWKLPYLSLGAGPMFLRYDINGEGGTKVLNNGHSSAEFGLPGKKVTTTTAALALTSQFDWKSLLLGLDVIIHGMNSADKRSTSLSLAIAYGIGG